MEKSNKEKQTPGVMSQQQFKDALESELGMLAALINFIRSTPRAMDALAEIAYQSNENRLQVQDAIKKVREEMSNGDSMDAHDVVEKVKVEHES